MHQCCDHALYERDTLCTRPARPPPPVVGYESICKNRFCKATVEESSSQDKIQSQASPPNPSPKPSPASPAQRPAASARFKVRFQKKETRSTLTLQKEGTKIYATVGRVWTRRIMRPPRSPPQSAANPRPKMDLQERRKKTQGRPLQKMQARPSQPQPFGGGRPSPQPQLSQQPSPSPRLFGGVRRPQPAPQPSTLPANPAQKPAAHPQIQSSSKKKSVSVKTFWHPNPWQFL